MDSFLAREVFFPVETRATEGWTTRCMLEMITGMVQSDEQMSGIYNNIFINTFVGLFDSIVSSMEDYGYHYVCVFFKDFIYLFLRDT